MSINYKSLLNEMAMTRHWTTSSSNEQDSYHAGPGYNAKSTLQETLAARSLPAPIYEHRASGPEHSLAWTSTCRLYDQSVYTGYGVSKKMSEQNAAHNAVQGLKDSAPTRPAPFYAAAPVPDESRFSSARAEGTNNYEETADDFEDQYRAPSAPPVPKTRDYKSMLNQLLQRLDCIVADFADAETNVPGVHIRSIGVYVKSRNQVFLGVGSAATKRDADQRAAKDLLHKLKRTTK
ncbi:uncharacterized protein MONBRDRAFT_11490 [Monosiga brevicollis MX1]|uniref:DRBM domain-containing protein n=1 Tax=Monosiga brevicollis TaxID=81824 RepID=A9V9B1_MONBE|nr:uncharacterized protein MONBRDRAFT_11490 [Monosiga brevicollis MX1]EDQ85900.1 predicted protein [Monosiga brevicollis MX1]|eukprot:XP_001749379.1 hypothetical protein [Monosiga brevicollis MX1]